jgi:hypothetical protein
VVNLTLLTDNGKSGKRTVKICSSESSDHIRTTVRYIPEDGNTTTAVRISNTTIIITCL